MKTAFYLFKRIDGTTSYLLNPTKRIIKRCACSCGCLIKFVQTGRDQVLCEACRNGDGGA